ncbi:hypothetical protein BDA99DRAFT_536337 [Phascolomyces articulosus]|uniref:Uncharacterized protein n=1 Tax=Phascolomyces articulosus TaxID=60185 RepID=A0AAD5K1E2_9FUNG|nr:hypothetical protein BDA99DRAFT_536337 [Phascolomyces articulosus]
MNAKEILLIYLYGNTSNHSMEETYPFLGDYSCMFFSAKIQIYFGLVKYLVFNFLFQFATNHSIIYIDALDELVYIFLLIKIAIFFIKTNDKYGRMIGLGAYFVYFKRQLEAEKG